MADFKFDLALLLCFAFGALYCNRMADNKQNETLTMEVIVMIFLV